MKLNKGLGGLQCLQSLQGQICLYLLVSAAIFFIPSITKAEGEIPITLRIEEQEAGVVNTTINLPESCDVVDTTTTTPTHFTGYKAICVLQTAQEQGLITFQVTNWGFGFALDEINTTANAADWSQLWILRQNNATTLTGIDGVVMNANDELLLTFGPWPMEPLKISLSTTTPQVGVTTTVNTDVWNDISNAFEPFNSTTTLLAGNSDFIETHESETGIFEWVPIVTGTLYVRAEAQNKTRSKAIIVTIIEGLTLNQTDSATSTTSTPTESNTPEPDNSNSNNSASGGGIIPEDVAIPQEQINNTINKILDYLKSQQDTDGKILDGGTTDWAIMSFGARGIYAEDIKAPTGSASGGSSTSLLDFAKAYQFTDPSDLNLCASYPRHALALLAAGVPSTDALIVSSTEKITSPKCNQNDAYGQNGINDDLFALLLLLELGNDATHPVVSTTLNTILKDQTADGAFTWAGWPAPDITGGALNAVKFAQQKGATIDDVVINNAKNYLRAQQLTDGGWGFGTSDALTTSWALMGINALGEGQTDWTNEQGKNPWHILTGQLKEAGYYEPSWAPGTVDWFATKHAIPALLGKSWPIILAPKPTPPPPQSNNSSSGGGGFIPVDVTSTTTTSTPALVIPETATTTISTSTLQHISTTTQEVEFTGTGGPEEDIEEIKDIGDIKKDIRKIVLLPSNNSQSVNSESVNTEPINLLTDEILISAASTTTIPFQNTAQGVFATAATLATTMGAYLVWRFVQTLV